MKRRIAMLAAVPLVLIASSCSLNTAEPATYVTDVSATLNGIVYSNEPGEVTYWFNYGTTTAYGTTTPDRTIEIPAGAEIDDEYSVSEPLAGLEPNTTYHFQACSSPGIEPGSRGCTNRDQTFTTGPEGSGRSGIAFYSSRSGAQEVYVMDEDGSDQTRLTDTPGFNGEPAWSPDAAALAFTSSIDDPFFEIYAMDPDGSDRIRLTDNDGSSVEDRHPAWSPDGEKVAFTSRLAGNFEVYVMDSDGSDLVNLTQDIFGDFEPSWSPDGSRIAFFATRNEHAGQYEIWTMNADGSNQTRLTEVAADDIRPAWSPDGRKIAFSSLRDGNYEIYVMNADGSNQTRLTTNPDADQDPEWSPDGSKIVFVSGRAGADDVWDDIWVMNANGTGKTQLTATTQTQFSGNHNGPDWSPRP